MSGSDPPPPADEPPGGDRIDPRRSACVLIGVGGYTRMPPLGTVRSSVAGLRQALTDRRIWGVPDSRVWQLLDPRSHDELTEPLYDAAKRAEDTLIVYYAGHGLLDAQDDQLYLTLPRTMKGRPETALAFGMFRDALRRARDEGRARRCVLILDCCYSGRATQDAGAMAGTGHIMPDRRHVEVQGSYVLTSTGDAEHAEAPPRDTYTAFTGALIRALEHGDPKSPGDRALSLDRIHGLVRDELLDRRMHTPWRLDQNGVGALPFVRNRASAVPPPRPAPARRALAAVGAAGLAVGLFAGVAVGYGLRERLRPVAEAAGDAIPGPCGEEGAELLDVSDRLARPPGNEHLGSRVEGLSALALTGKGGEALAMRDNEPAHLFGVRMGSPEELRPEVTSVRTLKGADGGRLDSFDGEGLVVEEGGETVLVAAEGGPSIRRFRLSDGTQAGEPLPLPSGFGYAPQGRAQEGRSLESLAASPGGRYLFAGMEGPLLGDADVHGRHQVRIQRYEGEAGGGYTPDRQFGYQTEEGLYLVELVAVAEDRLLALERGYLKGVGNAVRVYDVDLGGARDVSDRVLDANAAELLVGKRLVVDLGRCPPGGVRVQEAQPNPVLQNVEGMALAPERTAPGDDGRRTLYLVSDDNGRESQETRVHALSVDLGG
ncbi:esterase-like activity of phytase family protein [Nocardiopsis sp. RSe5-2]|uniref:Esterase-like activity of phytase family protein n=1 Tax=Nocardiopsis endophytica TaxID=3018445 RepID=A0ABT4U633_9ACTN|nr:esterase-like activity of phytase family protein [Nocardiopsis endophytica]MDA2812196.1 esterase-like activity of phytase family protein [Nocardiopsis endophytica]